MWQGFLRLSVFCGVLLFVAPAVSSAQSPVDLVRSIKASVLAAGVKPDVTPEDPCARFEITGRVAYALRSQGWGLIAKFGAQNQCRGYGVDAIVNRSGECRDILGGGIEGPNTPQWNLCSTDVALFRDPVDLGPLGSVVIPPVSPPNSQNNDTLLDVQAKVTDSQAKLRDLQAQVDEARKQLAALQQTADQIHEDTKDTRSKITEALKFISKYVLPAVGALIAGRQLGGN